MKCTNQRFIFCIEAPLFVPVRKVIDIRAKVRLLLITPKKDLPPPVNPSTPEVYPILDYALKPSSQPRSHWVTFELIIPGTHLDILIRSGREVLSTIQTSEPRVRFWLKRSTEMINPLFAMALFAISGQDGVCAWSRAQTNSRRSPVRLQKKSGPMAMRDDNSMVANFLAGDSVRVSSDAGVQHLGSSLSGKRETSSGSFSTLVAQESLGRFRRSPWSGGARGGGCTRRHCGLYLWKLWRRELGVHLFGRRGRPREARTVSSVSASWQGLADVLQPGHHACGQDRSRAHPRSL